MNKIKIVLLKQEDRKKDDYLVVSRCKFDVKDSRRTQVRNSKSPNLFQ